MQLQQHVNMLRELNLSCCGMGDEVFYKPQFGFLFEDV
jgi:hypothetical protein